MRAASVKCLARDPPQLSDAAGRCHYLITVASRTYIRSLVWTPADPVTRGCPVM